MNRPVPVPRFATLATLAALSAPAACGGGSASPSGDDGGATDAPSGTDAPSSSGDGSTPDGGSHDGATSEASQGDAGTGDGGGTTDAPSSESGSDAAMGPHPIAIIMMENHGYSDIIGDTTDAPYINGLATGYASATMWTDVNHPSLPNYLALTSGSFYNDPQDCIPTWATPTGDCTFDAPDTSLADQLTTAGITWKAYAEDLPSVCDTKDSFTGNYDVNHVPFLYYDHVVQTASECNLIVPYTQLATDIAADALPTFVWITPNLIDDMHDGTIADGDTFLSGVIPKIQATSWYKSGGSIIVTWDEGETEEQIVAIVVSLANAGHGAFATPGNHFGTLRGIEEVYGLKLLGSAADATNGDVEPLLQ
jgi:hypothetical protein